MAHGLLVTRSVDRSEQGHGTSRPDRTTRTGTGSGQEWTCKTRTESIVWSSIPPSSLGWKIREAFVFERHTKVRVITLRELTLEKYYLLVNNLRKSRRPGRIKWVVGSSPP